MAARWSGVSAATRGACAVSGRYRANNGELLRDAAIQGLGIAQLPTFIVGAALAGRYAGHRAGRLPAPDELGACGLSAASPVVAADPRFCGLSAGALAEPRRSAWHEARRRLNRPPAPARASAPRGVAAIRQRAALAVRIVV